MSTDAASISPTTIAHAVGPQAMPVALPQAILLQGVSWQTYLSLRDGSANGGLRMTFDQGVLEIMTLSSFHELISLLIHDFILEYRVARDIAVRPSGSMTLRRKLLDRGLEGDQSYYIASEPAVRNVASIDLETSPPPDLAIEVEHTSSSVRKMPLYAALGVPEVWRFSQETLTVHRLQNEQYVQQQASTALPDFPLEELRGALSRRGDVNETTLLREFRQWLADHERSSS